MIEYIEEPHFAHHIEPAIEHVKLTAAQYYTSILSQFTNHKNDKDVHVTREDREKWDNKADKVSLYDLEQRIVDKANKKDIPTLVSELKNDVPYLTASAIDAKLDNKGYVTWDDIKNKIGQQIDLANYATKTELSNYATRTELSNCATKTELSNYARKTDIPDMDNVIKRNETLFKYNDISVKLGDSITGSQSSEFSQATVNKLGGIKLGSSTVANASNDKTYPLTVDSNGRGYVKVDWTNVTSDDILTAIKNSNIFGGQQVKIENGYWYVRVYNEPTDSWSWQNTGVRAEGKDGTGVKIAGTVATVSALPGNPEIGDIYIIEDTGHANVWNGTTWYDMGQFNGIAGESSYLHIAYCNQIGVSDNDFVGFTTVAADGATYKYLGLCADNNELDPQTPTSYTWTNYQGPAGRPGYDGSGNECIFINVAEELNYSGVLTEYAQDYIDQEGMPIYSKGVVGNTTYTGVNLSTGKSKDGFIPVLDSPLQTWSRNPITATEELPYVYCSIRRKEEVEGTTTKRWGEFGPVALWTKYVPTQELIQGPDGPVVRNRGIWNVNTSDYNDGSVTESDGFRYIDVVIDDNTFYRCINKPERVNDGGGNLVFVRPSQDPGHWVEASQFNFIATGLLFSEAAWIEFLSSHEIFVTDNNSNPVAGITGSGETSSAVRFWAGPQESDGTGDAVNYPSSKFWVNGEGKLHAEDAEISGTIQASTLYTNVDSFYGTSNNSTKTYTESNLPNIIIARGEAQNTSDWQQLPTIYLPQSLEKEGAVIRIICPKNMIVKNNNAQLSGIRIVSQNIQFSSPLGNISIGNELYVQAHRTEASSDTLDMFDNVDRAQVELCLFKDLGVAKWRVITYDNVYTLENGQMSEISLNFL